MRPGSLVGLTSPDWSKIRVQTTCNDPKPYNEVMSSPVVGERNENGERFCDFCDMNVPEYYRHTFPARNNP